MAAAAGAARMIGAFALSEPAAGTDAANQQTIRHAGGDGATGSIGTEGLGGERRRGAGVIVVCVATQPGRRGQGGDGVSRARRRVPASRARRVDDSLGVRGLGCMDLDLDVHRGAGSGARRASTRAFGLAMWALQGGRVAIAAQALGIGQAALDEAIAHAKSARAVRPADRAVTRRFSG